MNKKVLPLTIPKETTIPRYTNLEAILSAHHLDYRPWFRSNFLQIRCPKVNERWLDLDFEPLFLERFCPFIHYRKVPKEVIDMDNITGFFMKCIDNNHYIYTIMDHYYVPLSVNFAANHVVHDSLIFGYDQDAGQFHVADFFNGQYQFADVPFHQLETGFREAKARLENDTNYRFTKDIDLLSINPVHSPKFDIDLAVNSLSNYINSRPDPMNSYLSSMKVYVHPEEHAYGMDVYEHVLAFLDSDPTRGYMNIRSLHLLWYHKWIVLQTIEYLLAGQQTESVTVDYRSIEQLMLISRNLMMKFSIGRDKENYNSVTGNLKEIRLKEKEIVERFLSLLSLPNSEQTRLFV